jgi:hypothetical protein
VDSKCPRVEIVRFQSRIEAFGWPIGSEGCSADHQHSADGKESLDTSPEVAVIMTYPNDVTGPTRVLPTKKSGSQNG